MNKTELNTIKAKMHELINTMEYDYGKDDYDSYIIDKVQLNGIVELLHDLEVLGLNYTQFIFFPSFDDEKLPKHFELLRTIVNDLDIKESK